MPLPLLAILAGAAIAGGGSGALLSRQGGAEKDLTRRINGETAGEGLRAQGMRQQSQGSRDEYLRNLQGFNPQAYMQQATTAALAENGEWFNALEARRGASLNNRGLYRSNLGGAAATRDLNTRISRDLSGLALQTGQMEQGRIDRYGDLYSRDRAYETDSTERYLDLLTGSRDYEMQRRKDRTGAIMGGASTGARLALAGRGG